MAKVEPLQNVPATHNNERTSFQELQGNPQGFVATAITAAVGLGSTIYSGVKAKNKYEERQEARAESEYERSQRARSGRLINQLSQGFAIEPDEGSVLTSPLVLALLGITGLAFSYYLYKRT